MNQQQNRNTEFESVKEKFQQLFELFRAKQTLSSLMFELNENRVVVATIPARGWTFNTQNSSAYDAFVKILHDTNLLSTWSAHSAGPDFPETFSLTGDLDALNKALDREIAKKSLSNEIERWANSAEKLVSSAHTSQEIPTAEVLINSLKRTLGIQRE